MKKLIVSRHPAAVEWVRSIPEWAQAEVETADVSASALSGREVAGPLPLHLIAQCTRYWAIEFVGPAPRGVEISVAEMIAAGARLVEYRVSAVEGDDPPFLPDLSQTMIDGEVWEIQAPDGARFQVTVTDEGTHLICPSGFRILSSYPRAWIAKRGPNA